MVKDGSGAIRQRFDYYPYGTVSYVWTNSSTTDSSEKRYRFSGKEIAGSSLTDLAGAGTAPGDPYLDFGARLYSPRTATWLSPDPLMEKYYGVSPFMYCVDNPIALTDSIGLSISAPIKALKVAKRALKTSNTAQRVKTSALVAAEIYGLYDDYITLTSTESSLEEKGVAVLDLTSGFGDEAKSLSKTLGFNALAETSFRSFTKRNFRHNFGHITGGIPEGAQAHHILPQKYRKEFSDIGINIDNPKYGAWLETTTHQKTKNAHNERWVEFFNSFKNNGRMPTIEDTEEFANKLMIEFYGATQ